MVFDHFTIHAQNTTVNSGKNIFISAIPHIIYVSDSTCLRIYLLRKISIWNIHAAVKENGLVHLRLSECNGKKKWVSLIFMQYKYGMKMMLYTTHSLLFQTISVRNLNADFFFITIYLYHHRLYQFLVLPSSLPLKE
jgi:hypothetical protein